NISALEKFRSQIDLSALDRIIHAMARASVIGVVGQRRAYPLSTYLFYGLSQLNCRVLLLDGPGALMASQLALLRPGDMLVAISFAPYAEGVLEAAQLASERNIDVI